MGDVINLNQHRKARARAQARRLAEENRARFGRSRTERLGEFREKERSTRTHDLLRLDETDRAKPRHRDNSDDPDDPANFDRPED